MESVLTKTHTIMADEKIYTVSGSVKNALTNLPVVDLHVLVYDEDFLTADQFLGIGVTNQNGEFNVQFDSSKFDRLFERKPDLYFVVKDGGFELLSTKESLIKNAGVNTEGINLTVDLSNDLLRTIINPTPKPWKGGFKESNPKFDYPNPDLSSLPMTGNLDNIPKLERQQKVVWPEFSWLSPQGRCYQMFAPDISRLGYDVEGRIYAIICPQQGFCIPDIGCMNVEVTVTGVRGWVGEPDKSLAGDMTVTGKIWFSPSANENPIIKALGKAFEQKNMPFPFNKANAINVTTHNPGDANQPIFPLKEGTTKAFELPAFSKHEDLSWNVANLEVEIGPIKPTDDDRVNRFNQTILNLFNIASGDMLKNGNVLTWNVWFTEPETVNIDDWTGHAERWRDSIQADHGSPEGLGTDARLLDGSPFKPLKDLFTGEIKELLDLKDSL